MRLYINDRLRVKDLQEHFQDCFPLLHLAFFSKNHKAMNPAYNGDIIDENELIENIRKRHEDGFLEIMSWHTCAKVQEQLRDKYSLNVKIICGNIHARRLQNSNGESLTLAQLNEQCRGDDTPALTP